jgi:potassium-transporting ATPase KdpC subunit
MHSTWCKEGEDMMMGFWKQLRIGIISTLVLALVVCGIYPALVWGIAQGLFPDKANGSLITSHGRTLGSKLLAQGFTGVRYFHPRPSSAGAGYDPMSSGGSNLGPLSKKLVDIVRQRAESYRRENGLLPGALVPADAVTSSGSGLDPHISLENALLQAPRVAGARNLNEEYVREKIAEHIQGRDLGILGEPGVNVLMLNLDLDNEGQGRDGRRKS